MSSRLYRLLFETIFSIFSENLKFNDMLILRKIDWYIQFIIMIAMVASIPLMAFFGFLIGLFALGIIQLLSATMNTSALLRNGFRSRIIRYWLFVVYDLCILFSAACWGGDIGQITIVIVLICASGIAVYYFLIYKKLIELMEIRKELAGFTKQGL